MARNFQEEIENRENTLQSMFDKMDEIRESFINESIEFLKPFWSQQAQLIVKNEPERTKELGVEKISELKREIKALEDKTPEIIRSFLEIDRIWWHRNRSLGYRATRTYHPSEFIDNPPSDIDNALRFAAGELAKIVEKYGFISKPNYHVSTGMWRGINKQSGSRPHPNNDSPFFPFAWKWNDKMASLMFEYNELREKVQAVEDRLKNLKQEKEQSEAEDLWNLA